MSGVISLLSDTKEENVSLVTVVITRFVILRIQGDNRFNVPQTGIKEALHENVLPEVTESEWRTERAVTT